MRSSPSGASRRHLMAAFGSAALLALSFASQTAFAAPLEGQVVESQSRWGYQKSAIVTESVIEKRDGSRVTVHQLGGSRGGIGMRVLHSPVVLKLGDQVVLDTKAKRTPSGRVLEQVQQVLSLRAADAEALKSEGAIDNQEFVRTANSTGADIYWKSGCAFLSVAVEGSTQISGDREFVIVDEVIAHWVQETRSCSTFDIVNEGTEDREVGLDGINLIKFREEFWCRPASGNDPQECYDQAAAGLTTLFFIDDAGSGRNGEIIDADIEFNGVQFAFAADGTTSGTQDCEADFANTLTHELGHFVGLDHTCWTNGPRLLDDEGKEVPSCSGNGLGPKVIDATMYNFQSCGETLKTTLTADDVAGFCSMYPSASTPDTCNRANIETAGCCSIAGPSPDQGRRWPAALLLLFLAIAALALTRLPRKQ